MEIVSIQHGDNKYKIGDDVFPSGNLDWMISQIDKTEVAGQMAMVTAFYIYATNTQTKQRMLWKQIVPADYEEEYLLED
jgi:hypothetical protein